MFTPIDQTHACDFTTKLPAETTWGIFSLVSLQVLCKCQLVSREWLDITSDPTLWKLIWQKKTGKLTQQKGNWKAKLCAIERIGRVKPTTSLFTVHSKIECLGNWKDYLVMKCKYSGFHFFSIQEMKQAGFLNCSLEATEMVFYQDRMITLHTSNEIYVWDLKTFKRQKRIPFLASNFCVDGQKLYSQMNNQIQEWDLITLKIKRRYRAPSIRNRTLNLGAVRGERMVFFSHAFLIVCDHSYNSVTVLTGHRSWIYKVELVGDLLISSSNDGTLKIWDLNTEKCIKTLETSDEVWSFTVYDGQLFAYSFDKVLYLWNFSKGLERPGEA